MPTSVAGSKRTLLDPGGHEQGFTLIELMIVVTIIGLASAVVVLALPDPRGRLRDEGAQFAARARAAHDLAVVTARPVSVWVSAGGYGFDARRDGVWVALSEKPLRVTRWSKGTEAVPASGARDRILFDSTGSADRSLDVVLHRSTENLTVRIGNDGRVKIGA
jgi:general secretion pathway protein H